MIAERFRSVDSDSNGSIGFSEFSTWQGRLGAAATNEQTSLAYEFEPVPAAILPDIDNDPKGQILRLLVQPLNSLNLITANVNYDEGMSLEEFLAFQNTRFDEADADANGRLDPLEIRGLSGNQSRGRRPDQGVPGVLPPPATIPPG